MSIQGLASFQKGQGLVVMPATITVGRFKSKSRVSEAFCAENNNRCKREGEAANPLAGMIQLLLKLSRRCQSSHET
jgi:hypothetical protein